MAFLLEDIQRLDKNIWALNFSRAFIKFPFFPSSSKDFSNIWFLVLLLLIDIDLS